MEFSPQRLSITKVIVELTELSGNLDLVENRMRRETRFEGNAVAFYEND